MERRVLRCGLSAAQSANVYATVAATAERRLCIIMEVQARCIFMNKVKGLSRINKNHARLTWT